jgi:acetyl-CoA carboxylase alpha subunit
MHINTLKIEIEELTRSMTIEEVINETIKDVPAAPQEMLDEIWQRIQDSLSDLDGSQKLE